MMSGRNRIPDPDIAVKSEALGDLFPGCRLITYPFHQELWTDGTLVDRWSRFDAKCYELCQRDE